MKRKLHELNGQLESLKGRLSPEEAAANPQAARLEDMILMLEWVLNEPTGSYHG